MINLIMDQKKPKKYISKLTYSLVLYTWNETGVTYTTDESQTRKLQPFQNQKKLPPTAKQNFSVTNTIYDRKHAKNQ